MKNAGRTVICTITLPYPVTILQRLINTVAAVVHAMLEDVAFVVQILGKGDIKLSSPALLAAIRVSKIGSFLCFNQESKSVYKHSPTSPVASAYKLFKLGLGAAEGLEFNISQTGSSLLTPPIRLMNRPLSLDCMPMGFLIQQFLRH